MSKAYTLYGPSKAYTLYGCLPAGRYDADSRTPVRTPLYTPPYVHPRTPLGAGVRVVVRRLRSFWLAVADALGRSDSWRTPSDAMNGGDGVCIPFAGGGI